MDFPRFVFMCPGSVERHGGTYDQELVNDQEEYDAAIKAGYHPDLDAAIRAEKKDEKKDEKLKAKEKAEKKAKDSKAKEKVEKKAEEPKAEEPKAEEPKTDTAGAP